jgi:uncharacterized protein (TIGR04255 family)
MNKYITFPKPPIHEALIDLRVEFPNDYDVSHFEGFHDLVKDRFPDKQKKMAFEPKFQVIESKLTSDSAPVKPIGYLFRSNTESKIVQARLDGFTFNKLRPYENWEVFKKEAAELWNKYYDKYTPAKITRITLRYINQIEIPLPMKDFNDYILTVPAIPDGLPQSLSSYLLRIEVPNPDINATAIITQTFEQPMPNKLPFIFDIDVFIQTNFTDNNTEIWNMFENMRDFKNDIFLKNITSKTKELFK